jgi:hypothetical protein
MRSEVGQVVVNDIRWRRTKSGEVHRGLFHASTVGTNATRGYPPFGRCLWVRRIGEVVLEGIQCRARPRVDADLGVEIEHVRVYCGR